MKKNIINFLVIFLRIIIILLFIIIIPLYAKCKEKVDIEYNDYDKASIQNGDHLIIEIKKTIELFESVTYIEGKYSTRISSKYIVFIDNNDDMFMAKIENLDYDKLLEKINKGENVTMYGIVTTLDDNYNEMLYNENASIQYSITDYDFFINEDGKIDFSQNKNAIYAIKDYLLKKCGDYQIDLSFVSETKDGPYKNAYLYVIIMNFVFIYIMCKLKSYCN